MLFNLIFFYEINLYNCFLLVNFKLDRERDGGGTSILNRFNRLNIKDYRKVVNIF